MLWNDYAMLAAEYYVTGRFAASAGYVPLCGNLLHHSFELLLKCARLRSRAVPEDRADADLRKLEHNLSAWWLTFKGSYPSPGLEEFDDLISLLDQWEEIRYPKRGIALSVTGLASQPQIASAPSIDGVKTYQLNVAFADQCINRLWFVIGLNPELFGIAIGATHHPLAASISSDDNSHMIYA